MLICNAVTNCTSWLNFCQNLVFLEFWCGNDNFIYIQTIPNDNLTSLDYIAVHLKVYGGQ